MPSPPGSEVTRRRLLAAGTSNFLPGIPRLENVPAEINTIRRLFAAMGYQADPIPLDLDRDSLLTRCGTTRKSSEPGDVVVAYYTSHGIRDQERFYLLASNSDPEALDDTAIPAEDLARRLIKNSKAAQVLIILDMCYAGGGMADITRLAGQLAFTAGDRDPALFVIAAAGIKQTAQQTAFVSGLAAVLDHVDERLAGKVQPYLQIGSLITEVNEQLGITGSQRARWSCFNAEGECFALPNPNYRSGISPGLDLETQRAFEEHWIPKARSAELGVGGWYFTGREQALRELVNWFNRPRSDGKARVVTGSAGSGKSALLARLVTLSDLSWRQEILETSSVDLPQETVPPAELVNAAVVLRRKLLADVVAQLARQLHINATEVKALRETIRASGKKTVLVFDALDEADERQKIIAELLRPLAEVPHVFLLVGTRADPGASGVPGKRRVESFGEASEEIDLDVPFFGNPADVETYVKRRLLATEELGRSTPYQSSPDRAEAVARAVASRCSHSFLVARTAVTVLLARPDAVNVDLPGWEQQLPRGFEEALEQFLRQVDQQAPAGLSSEVARAALLPLAFAEGEGLPWERIWARLAAAISARPITDEQIVMLREQAAPFIVEALENSGSVYRLFHERAAEYLRSTVDQGQAMAAIATALIDLVPPLPAGEGLDWPAAHPYIRSHLPAHALKAGQLGELATDELFLAACDPPRLLPALRDLPAGTHRALAATYEHAFDNLPGTFPQQRLSYLELSARQLGCNKLADAWQRTPLDRPWVVPWAQWSITTPHRKIPAHSGVRAMATANLEGRPVIVSGSGDETVRVWDLASGAPLQTIHIGIRVDGGAWALDTFIVAHNKGMLAISLGNL